MCANACPVSCIYIQSVGKGQDALMTQFDIDYTKCLFCDLCTPPCPTECIWMTQEFDLASYTKDDCIINFAAPRPKTRSKRTRKSWRSWKKRKKPRRRPEKPRPKPRVKADPEEDSGDETSSRMKSPGNK
jgi:formate hydrogenlyase subunit 6/NADH:ubiquinone oxidoreductase subunit I